MLGRKANRKEGDYYVEYNKQIILPLITGHGPVLTVISVPFESLLIHLHLRYLFNSLLVSFSDCWLIGRMAEPCLCPSLAVDLDLNQEQSRWG